MKTLAEELQFYRVWRCKVLSSGYHNGATCNPSDPHGGDWDCEYRWISDLPDTEEIREAMGAT